MGPQRRQIGESLAGEPFLDALMSMKIPSDHGRRRTGQRTYNVPMGAEELSRGEATRLLRRVTETSPGAGESAGRLMDLVYQELRQLAGGFLSHERSDHTLQPTALVHEAYLRLIDQEVEWQGRAHFMGIAAQSMRRILVDHARGVKRLKRGGGLRRVELSEDLAEATPAGVDVLALDTALAELSGQSERMGRIVELRFFGGLELTAIGELLGVSERTVRRDWRYARAWLTDHLEQEGG